MHIRSIKFATFAATTVAALALGGRFYWFLQNRAELTTPSSPAWERHIAGLETQARTNRNPSARKAISKRLENERHLRKQDRGVSWWWTAYRKKFLESKSKRPNDFDAWENYENLHKVNLSGHSPANREGARAAP